MSQVQQQAYSPQQQQGYPQQQQQGYPQQQQQGYPQQQQQGYPQQQPGYPPQQYVMPIMPHPHSAHLPPVYGLAPPDNWRTDLCDCCMDKDSCCETIWCEYCVLGRIQGKLETGNVDPRWCSCFMILLVDMFFCCGLAKCYTVYSHHGKVRQRFNIDPNGSCVPYCCKGCFCNGLIHCQTHRELTARGYWPGAICDTPNQTFMAKFAASAVAPMT